MSTTAAEHDTTGPESQDDAPQEIEDALDRFGTDLAVFSQAARTAADEARGSGIDATADPLERVTERLGEEFDALWRTVREARRDG